MWLSGSVPSLKGTTQATRTTGDLVERCIDGDEYAWVDLVQRYERLVFSIARREGLSVDEASDVTQSCFLALLRCLETIRDTDRIDAWLAVVARRSAWRVRNSSQREVPASEEIAKEIAADEVDAIAAKLDVHHAVEQLDEPCRTLIRALFLEGGSNGYASIAARIGRPIGSVGPLRARCLLVLRRTLEATHAFGHRTRPSMQRGGGGV